MTDSSPSKSLAVLEATYYGQWMGLGGDTNVRAWTKRRAMFWGLLLTDNRDGAYQQGRALGPRLGYALTTPSAGNLRLQWFLSKAVLANLFEVTQDGNHFNLKPRHSDPWADLLVRLARALASGASDPLLPSELPNRAPLSVGEPIVLRELTRTLLGAQALVACEHAFQADDQDARELCFAVLRQDREAALHWFRREWSFRAKERFRKEVQREQLGLCACCGSKDQMLQLNHIQKVRDWGPTTRDNLEALCQPCHRYVDSHGSRCHSIWLRRDGTTAK